MRKTAVILFSIFILSACGRDGATVNTENENSQLDNGTRTVESVTKPDFTITSGNYFFSPNVLTLKANKPIKILFKNFGYHTFTINELGINFKLSKGQEEFSFTPQKRGTFSFYCEIGDHKQKGMVGTLVVI